MILPQWVLAHREPKTEIKFIKGAYYKYSVSYKYNPDKKRTDKISGVLLGKITETGFEPSVKNEMRTWQKSNPVDIKNFGLFRLFYTLVEEEYKQLQSVFPEDVCSVLFSFALFRWGYNTPIKRAGYYFSHDFCSEEWKGISLTDKEISAVLKTVGEQRTTVVEWMSDLLSDRDKNKQEFVMMDSTHVFSQSELLTVNAKGYNANFDFDKQVRLMYLFSTQQQKPVYYRLINGNITDVKSMALCVKEMNIAHVIYIADKGFYSKENIKGMQDQGLQYIIPLHRNNTLINYAPIAKANFKQKLNYFLYQGRIIWYYFYKREGQQLITFLDEGLRAKEEADYATRIINLPEQYTQEKFAEKLPQFGTLTFVCHTHTPKNAEEIYLAYKQRNEVENVFDAYKNFLQADLMYMQNRYVLEGWLTANFIAMLAYHKLYTKLKAAKKLSKFSVKDIIELSKSVYKLKINNQWQLSEITKKHADLFKQLNIDYLSERS